MLGCPFNFFAYIEFLFSVTNSLLLIDTVLKKVCEPALMSLRALPSGFLNINNICSFKQFDAPYV